MRKTKKWLAGLLCAVLLAGLLPTAALAAGADESAGSDGAGGESTAKLSDGTEVTSNSPITRAQLAEMIYANEQLKKDIGVMAWGNNPEPSFTDIDNCTEVQKAAIKELYKAKIINGTSETTFDPTGTVTRGTAVALIWRAAGGRSNKEPMTQTFTDLHWKWYEPAVNCFFGAGILNGASTNTFDGESNVPVSQVNVILTRYSENYDNFISKTNPGTTTRAEMAVELYEKYQPVLSAVTPSGDAVPFTDIYNCTSEEKNAIEFFFQREIIMGTAPTTFTPHAPITNFTLATLLQRCSEAQASAASEPEPASLFRAAAQANTTDPWAFLSGQGVDVSDARNNPDAPALTSDLTGWSDALVPSGPTFSPAAGTYVDTQTVTISPAAGDTGAKIYYTTDGTEPTISSTEYTTPIAIAATTTVRAIVVHNNLISSAAAAGYTIGESEQPAELSISASPTSLTGGGTVTLTVAGAGDATTVSVTCTPADGVSITGSGTSWTATLPNATAAYTFTVTAGGKTATCTVSVTETGSVDIEYTKFKVQADHLTSGYFTIKNVSGGNKIQSGHKYLVQLVHSGVASIFVVDAQSDNTLKFLCNSVTGDSLGVWDLTAANITDFADISNATVNALNSNCVVWQQSMDSGFFVNE